MNQLTRSRWWCGAGVLLLAALPSLAETRTAPTVVIGPDEVVQGDLYAAGSTVRVEGTVEGDVVAAAGTVEIPGHVKGDVLAVTGTLKLSGVVDGSLRVMAGQLELRGRVGEDVLAGVGSFTADPAASIGRDVVASAGGVTLRAPVGRDLSITGGNVVLGAPVAGAANLTVQSLVLEAPAEIGGELKYTSQKVATLSSGATVGSITHVRPDSVKPSTVLFGFLLSWLRAFFAFSLLGVLMALVSPRFTRAAPEVLRETPWHSVGWGALVLLAAPFATFALFFAGLALGGWWLGLIAGALVLSAVAMCFPVVGYQLGQRAMSKTSEMTGSRRLAALVLGVAAMTLVLRIPYLGALLALGVVVAGLGSMVMAGVQLRRGAVS